jgi:hypothetical protein
VFSKCLVSTLWPGAGEAQDSRPILIFIAVLNATAKLQHTSELPAGATLDQGIAALHDHEFFMRCNPIASEVRKLEVNEPEAQAALKAITEQAPVYDVEILPGREAETFRIVDVIPK